MNWLKLFVVVVVVVVALPSFMFAQQNDNKLEFEERQYNTSHGVLVLKLDTSFAKLAEVIFNEMKCDYCNQLKFVLILKKSEDGKSWLKERIRVRINSEYLEGGKYDKIKDYEVIIVDDLNISEMMDERIRIPIIYSRNEFR